MDILQCVGTAIMGICAIAMGFSVVLFKYYAVNRSTLKHNWNIIAMVLTGTFSILFGLSMHITPFILSGLFMPIQIISMLITNAVLMGARYSVSQIVLILAVCLMYIPIILLGPSSMHAEDTQVSFLQNFEDNLGSTSTVAFLVCYSVVLLLNLIIVFTLQPDRGYIVYHINGACILAILGSTCMAVTKIMLEVMERVTKAEFIPIEYWVVCGCTPLLALLEIACLSFFYSKLNISIIYPVKAAFTVLLAWLQSAFFFHDSPNDSLVFGVCMIVLALLLTLYIFLSPLESLQIPENKKLIEEVEEVEIISDVQEDVKCEIKPTNYPTNYDIKKIECVESKSKLSNDTSQMWHLSSLTRRRN